MRYVRPLFPLPSRARGGRFLSAAIHTAAVILSVEPKPAAELEAFLKSSPFLMVGLKEINAVFATEHPSHPVQDIRFLPLAYAHDRREGGEAELEGFPGRSVEPQGIADVAAASFFRFVFKSFRKLQPEFMVAVAFQQPKSEEAFDLSCLRQPKDILVRGPNIGIIKKSP